MPILGRPEGFSLSFWLDSSLGVEWQTDFFCEVSLVILTCGTVRFGPCQNSLSSLWIWSRCSPSLSALSGIDRGGAN